MTDTTVPTTCRPFAALAIALLLGLAPIAAPAAATAQDAPASEAPAAEPEAAPETPETTPDTVVATVAGEEITEADLAFAAEDLQQELAQMPPQERRPFLVSVLIDMKVMANEARERGLDESDVFQRRLDYLEGRALRRAFFAEVIAAGVTADAVRAAYDELVAEFEPQEEIRASHILVESEAEAEAIIDELEAGASFEDLAMERSTDPSAQQNSGDLGFFSRGMMVQPFEEAAFALAEPGAVSEPVQSNFGWHVIRLEERRQSEPPPFEQLAPQLQQQVLFESFEETLNGLKEDVAVDIPDAELAAAVERQRSEQQQPAEQQPAEQQPAE